MRKFAIFSVKIKFALLLLCITVIVSVIADERRHFLKRTIYQGGTIGEPSENKTDSIHFEPPQSKQRNIASTSKLERPGNDGSPTSAFPLQKCQGDCDTDKDCATNLKCFIRKPGDDIKKIPGCTTSTITKLTKDGTDYCYDPNDAVAAPIKPPSPIASPRNAPKAAPTATSGTILYKGEDWTPRDAYPLGICEGDCDGDYDCEGELVCHQRDMDVSGKLGHVPSCAGRDTTTRDYCIRPSDEIAIPPVSDAFRLKKYWQFGYKWQDEFWEQEWCMECNGGNTDACEIGDSIIISHCSHDHSTWFVYKNLKDGISQIQVAVNSNLCLQLVGNNDIQVRACDGTKQRQKFKSLNGNFGGTKFELGTVERDGCISQHHHPKDGEIIFRMDCALTRKHTTSYWTQY